MFHIDDPSYDLYRADEPEADEDGVHRGRSFVYFGFIARSSLESLSSSFRDGFEPFHTSLAFPGKLRLTASLRLFRFVEFGVHDIQEDARALGWG